MMKKAKRYNIASDIIVSNILTRLPAKTLIRFTSAFKSWYSLLSDPYFINLHNQIQKNNISNDLLLFEVDNDPVVVSMLDSFSPEQSSILSFKDTCNFPFDWAKVVGYCDGIVCVFTTSIDDGDVFENRISLWNPALRTTKIIACCDKVDAWARLCIGFGYNNQTNDYNLITFYTYAYTPKDVKIYSLALDSWRMIDYQLVGVNDRELLIARGPYEQGGVYVRRGRPGGAYCWLANNRIRNGNSRETRIISFNMEDASFKEIMLPYNTSIDKCGKNTLFIYKDSLAVLHTHYLNAFTDAHGSLMCYIWVMKEYNNPESWTNLCKFDSQCSCISFMGVIETDQVLLLCGDLCERVGGPINKKVNVVDIDKSQMKPVGTAKDINFLTLTEGRYMEMAVEKIC